MVFNKGDFVEIEYTAIDIETNKIFDLTSEEKAKKEGIYNKNAKYGPIIICIGENQVIKGLDEFIVGKELKKEYSIEIPPEQGFGKKDPKLMKMLPTKVFKEKRIQPFPGLQINIDGFIGTIRVVSGGRSIVDFNHPLAGHKLLYHLKVNRLISDDKEKIEFILKQFSKEPKFSLNQEELKITTDLPDQIQKELENNIKRLIPEIKKVTFNKTTSKK